MANLVIKGGTSQQVVDGSQDALTILAVNNGTGLVHVGDPSPAGFDVPFRGGDQIILPANEPATLRADGFVVIVSIGAYGGQTYEGGGDLPPNQAIVTDSEIVTAAGGQTIDIHVTDNVATFGVRPFPFFEPFTVTVGALDNPYVGYSNFEGEPTIGSITNEPTDDFTLPLCMLNIVSGQLMITLTGPQPLQLRLAGALVGINAEDFTIDPSNASSRFENDSWRTDVFIEGVPPWTVGQQIPIVIIPQNG